MIAATRRAATTKAAAAMPAQMPGVKTKPPLEEEGAEAEEADGVLLGVTIGEGCSDAPPDGAAEGDGDTVAEVITAYREKGRGGEATRISTTVGWCGCARWQEQRRSAAHSHAHLLHDGRCTQGRDGKRLGRGRRSRAATRRGKSGGEGGGEG